MKIPKEEEIIENIYEEILNLPYNSAYAYYKLFNKGTVESLGTNCYGLAKALKDKLSTCGFTKSYYLRSNRAHSLVLKLGEKVFFFNPYLLHKKPIRLDRILKSKKKTFVFEAYPKVRIGKINKNSFLKFNKLPDKSFLVEKFRFNRVKNDYSVSSFIWRIRETKRSGAGYKNKKFLFDTEQTTLSMRFLDKQKQEVNHLIYPLFPIKNECVQKKNLYLKLNDGSTVPISSKDFNKKLTEFTKNLPFNKSYLIKYLLDGAKLYKLGAPKKLIAKETNPSNN